MDVQILRTAALELQAVDDNDIVKVAGIFRRIKNWWQAFRDPKYRQRVEALQNESVRIKHLIDGLGEQIELLQAAIKDTDVPLYERSLNQVRQLSLELSRDLYGFRQDMNAAIRAAPIDVVEVQEKEPENESEKAAIPKKEEDEELRARWHYTAEELKDPVVREQMKQQLPSDHDVPIGNINRPMREFNWFTQIAPENIYLSQNFVDYFQGLLADALSRKISVYGNDEADKAFYHALMLTPEIDAQIRQKLPEAILNGTLKRYTFQKPSEQVKNRPANEMLAVVHTDNFEIILPQSEVFQGTKPITLNALVFLNDMRASYIGSSVLSASGSKFVRIISHDEPVMGQEVVEQQSPEEIVDQPEQATPAQETPVPVGAVIFPSDRFWVSDIPGDRRRKFQTQEQAMTFAEEKAGQGNVSVLDEDPQTKQAQIRSLELLRFANQELIKRAGAVEMMRTPISKTQLKQALAEELQRRGLPPKAADLMAAQVGLETSFRNIWNYNIGNITAGKSWQGNYWIPPWVGKYGPRKDTERNRRLWKEWKQGRAPSRFRAYNSMQEGIKDYVSRLIHDFPGVLQAAYMGDPKLMAQKIDSEGYCPDCDVEKMEKLLRANMDKPSAQQFEVPPDLEQDYQNLMRMLFASGPLEKIVRKAIEREVLPTTRVLLVLNSNVSFPVQVRYAKILSSALRSELGAESSVHTNKKRIEIETDVVGTEKPVLKAVNAIADGVKNAFELSVNGHRIYVNAFIGCDSKYPILDSMTSEECFRKFAFEMMDKNV